MPLSFAYGSNMDRAAMATRCPSSRPLGPARLPGFRPVIMAQGWLSVVPDARREVWGLLWEVALADIAALDRYEEVGAGLYRKVYRPVLTQGGPRRALIYLGRDAGPGRANPGYLEGVLAAARELGLPASYLPDLAALAGTGRPSSACPPGRIGPGNADERRHPAVRPIAHRP